MPVSSENILYIQVIFDSFLHIKCGLSVLKTCVCLTIDTELVKSLDLVEFC